MKKKLLPLDENGFSLAGILVGIALLGILTLGMTQVFSNMLKGQNYNKFRSQVENFGEEFRAQLSSKTICTANFKDIALDPLQNLNIPAIKDASNNLIYKTGVNLGDNSFTIASMDFKGTPAAPWYVEDNPAALSGRATLTVNYRAVAEQAGPKDFFRTYTLATHRDNSGKLVDCMALAKMTDGIWRYNPATTSDIYFTGGKVGIGTTNPVEALEVDGAMRLGTTTSVCDSNGEGLIRYNSTIHNMEFCNGTTWATFGSGAGAAQIFDANGTWTKPASGTFVKVQCWGAGGGGARSSALNPYAFNGGGGGGGYVTSEIPLTSVGATVSITIGTGGSGSSANSNGGNGTDTIFGSFVIAAGGKGGLGGNAGRGGAGGGGSGGVITVGGLGAGDQTPDSGSTTAGNSTYAGAGGGMASVQPMGGTFGTAGGTSQAGGSGGAGSVNGQAGDGATPGGGGGASVYGTSGRGGNGRCTVEVH